jgi:glycosyltransferase involved in cell wall biosynthesis
MPLKIVHVCSAPLVPQHPDFERLRGVYHSGHWVVDLARAQRGHTALRPELLVNVPGSTVDFDAELEGVPVHYLRCPANYRVKTLLLFETHRLASRLRQLRPDLAHAHGTEDAHVLAAQRSGLPYVITAQGIHCIINPLLRRPWWHRQKVIEFLERRALLRARHLIAKSDYIGDKLRQLFPNLRIHRIPNTFDPEIAALPPAQKTNHQIVFVGTLDERKGLHILRAALETVRMKIPSITLKIAGAGRERAGYAAQEERALKQLLGARCDFMGRLPHLEAVRAVAGAQVLVAPSVEEMFGNQVIEALLVRTHCIVSSATAMAENVQRFGNGTVFQNSNAADLAEKLARVLNQQNFPEAESARARVLEYMAPARVAAAHAELYHLVLQERDRGGGVARALGQDGQ